VLVVTVAFATVIFAEDAAFAGLALTYVLDTVENCQTGVKQFAEVENLMTSAERVMAYTKLDPEPGYHIQTLPPKDWPSDGTVTFKNVQLRYYPGGPQVLKNLNFVIEGRMKIGIVGRTGDGKSSIVAALLRMPEAEGDILIDGVSVNAVNLQASRRSITLLSQSPVLFSGALRRNLDPLGKHEDSELWNVLEDVQLKDLVQSFDGQLDYALSEKGGNLSVGERQLICLARTLLQQSKVVILDEPTAHVDPDTERTIWNTVHDKLKNCTVITIAHRLNTVQDCDMILVIRNGEVAEFESTNTLFD